MSLLQKSSLFIAFVIVQFMVSSWDQNSINFLQLPFDHFDRLIYWNWNCHNVLTIQPVEVLLVQISHFFKEVFLVSWKSVWFQVTFTEYFSIVFI